MLVPELPRAAAYLVALLLAIVIAAWLAAREGRRLAIDRPTWLLLIGTVAVASVVGSTFLFLDFSAPSPGRKSNLGGIIAGIAAVVLLTRVLRLSLREVLDAFTVPTLAGLAIGRVGCFLAGCCRGIVTDAPWGVHYGAHEEAVHPVQLYEAAGDLALLVWIARTPRGAPAGRRLQAGVVGYGLLRIATEFLRDGRTTTWGLNPVQWSLVAIVTVVALWMWRDRRGRTTRVTAPVIGDLARETRVAWTTIAVCTALLALLWFAPERFAADERLVMWLAAIALPMAVLLTTPAWRRRAMQAGLAMTPLGAFLFVESSDSTKAGKNEILVGGSTWGTSYLVTLGERTVQDGVGCAGEPITTTQRVDVKRRTTAGRFSLGWRRTIDADTRLTFNAMLVTGRNSLTRPAYGNGPDGLDPLMTGVPQRANLFATGGSVGYEGREGELEGTLLHGDVVRDGRAHRSTIVNGTLRLGTRGGVYLEVFGTNPSAFETTGEYSYGGIGYTLGARRPRVMVGVGKGVVAGIQVPTEHVEFDVMLRGRAQMTDRLDGGPVVHAGLHYRWRP